MCAVEGRRVNERLLSSETGSCVQRRVLSKNQTKTRTETTEETAQAAAGQTAETQTRKGAGGACVFICAHRYRPPAIGLRLPLQGPSRPVGTYVGTIINAAAAKKQGRRYVWLFWAA